VTGNPHDRLTTLMSVGEVLPVRVTARGGHDGRRWRLRTLDVEDSEQCLASPSLLPDGPPWLVMAELAPDGATVAPTGAAAELPAGGIALPEVLLVPAPTSLPGVPPLLAPEPEAVPLPSSLAVDGLESLRRQITALESRFLNEQRLRQALQVELDELRVQASESHLRAQQLAGSAKKARTDLRIEKQKSQRLEKQVRSARSTTDQSANAEVLFLDPVEQFMHEVDLAYAHRLSAEDKATRPRRTVHVGPDFLATLSSVEGIDRSKVVDVTVEILTDLVNVLDSRELHPLREGNGAAARDVIRQRDGARCMRAALQTKSPSARRLHYWRIDEAIELSRVVKHDDMTP